MSWLLLSRPQSLWGCSISRSRSCKLGITGGQNAGLASLIIETGFQMVADLIYNRKGSKNEVYWVISGTQDKIKDLYNIKV